MSGKFETLVDKYHRLVMHLVSQYYGGALRHQADDLSQEIWTKLWEQFKKNEKNIVNFKSYLYRTVQTTLWDAIRRCERLEQGVENGTEFGEDRDEPRILAKVQVERLMRDLKPEEKLMVQAYLKGFNNGEIATMLGCTEGRVRNLLFRIRKKWAGLGAT